MNRIDLGRRLRTGCPSFRAQQAPRETVIVLITSPVIRNKGEDSMDASLAKIWRKHFSPLRIRSIPGICGKQ